MSLAPVDNAKRAAAARALEMVEDGMTLGLGTGSTAGWFVRLLSERIRATGLVGPRGGDLERDGLAGRGTRRAAAPSPTRSSAST